MTPKEIDTLTARFALAGYELRVLQRPHTPTLFEVQRGPEAFVLSHWPDVEALLRQLQKSRSVRA